MALTPEEQAELQQLQASYSSNQPVSMSQKLMAIAKADPRIAMAMAMLDDGSDKTAPISQGQPAEQGLQEPLVSPLDFIPVGGLGSAVKATGKLGSKAMQEGASTTANLAKKIAGSAPEVKALIQDIKSNKILSTAEGKLKQAVTTLEELIGGKSEDAVRAALKGKQVQVDPAMLKGNVPELYQKAIEARRPVNYSSVKGPNYDTQITDLIEQRGLPLEKVTREVSDLPSSTVNFNRTATQGGLPLERRVGGGVKVIEEPAPTQFDLFKGPKQKELFDAPRSTAIPESSRPVKGIGSPSQQLAWETQEGLPLQTVKETREAIPTQRLFGESEVATQYGLPLPNVTKQVVDAPVSVDALSLLSPKRSADALAKYPKNQTMLDPVTQAKIAEKKIAADYMRDKLYEAGAKEPLRQQQGLITGKKYLDKGLRKDPIAALSGKEGTTKLGLLGRVDEMTGGDLGLVDFAKNLTDAKNQTAFFKGVGTDAPGLARRLTGRVSTEARAPFAKLAQGLSDSGYNAAVGGSLGSVALPISRSLTNQNSTPKQQTGLNFLEQLELETLKKQYEQ